MIKQQVIGIICLGSLTLACQTNESEKETQNKTTIESKQKSSNLIIEEEYTNSQFTLTSPESEYEEFLSEDKLMDLVEFHYPELFLNHKESGTTGIIDKVEVKANRFKPPGMAHDYVYSQVRFYQNGSFKTLFILHFPDDTGYLDPDLGYRESGVDELVCTDCFLLDVSVKEERVVGTFATDRTMTKLYTRDMSYNLQEASVYWEGINN